MLKEIAEQPAAVADTLLGHFVDGQIVLDEQRLSDQDLRDIDKVFVVACGTAYHSGLLAKYAIEHWTRLPVEVELASEFRYRDPVLDRSTLVVAISQSGETADTLEAVRHAKDAEGQGAGDLQHQRRADPARVRRGALHPRRPEIGVASTKTFLAQVAANYLVGLALAQARGTKYPDEVAREFARARGDAGRWSRRCWRLMDPVARAGAASSRSRRRCCSSAGTSATRWRSRARSSSRSWPTCTPRASPPASSSTARSR